MRLFEHTCIALNATPVCPLRPKRGENWTNAPLVVAAMGRPALKGFVVQELLNVKQVASILSISQRQVWKLLAAGKVVSPVRLGRSVRFRASDISRWVELGCPSREVFEASLPVRTAL